MTAPMRKFTLSKAASAKPRLRWHADLVAPLILGLIVLAVIGAPLVAPYDPYAQDLMHMLEGPSAAHPFGTDILGRDVLSRVIWGGWPPLVVGVGSVIIATAFGTLCGIVAGFRGGVFDSVVSRIADIQMSIPGLVLALLVLALFGSAITNLIFIIAIESWPLHFRVVRSHVRSVRGLAYVEAAALAGQGAAKILRRHVLPSTMPLLAVTATVNFSTAVLAEAGLSFLGLGIQPPTADWGMMVSEGQTQLGAAWWMSVFPGLALLVVLLCAQTIGDTLSRRTSVRAEG
ncbi:MAG: peptide ABC transporter permease [Rhodobacteraceae bacterium]|nr:peptide ABC transporter permease [Paracoccaceae bacterium]MAY44335.1 peptide ABC transporter permease [Paracoccaceae bacterium]